MTTITFDTLKYAKRLKDAGFTESQAEALASAGAELIGENLATKLDLEALRADLQRDMKELEHRLVARICQALLVQTFALAGIVIALVKSVLSLRPEPAVASPSIILRATRRHGRRCLPRARRSPCLRWSFP
ncbi:hypothetical protein BH18PSE1_BH18PSE1_08360 [soil metagenome]